jgi:hypothetical protein
MQKVFVIAPLLVANGLVWVNVALRFAAAT